MHENLPDPHSLNSLIHNLGLYGLIASTFALVRYFIAYDKRSKMRLATTVFVSMPVGVIAGYIAQDFFTSEGAIMGCVAVAALGARDIVEIILDTFAYYRRNPEKIREAIERKKD